MLLWSLLFLMIAIITGILAFTGVVVAVTFVAKLLFYISIICLLIFWLLLYLRKKKNNP